MHRAGRLCAGVCFLSLGWVPGGRENTALPGVTVTPAATGRVGVPLALRSCPHLLLSNSPSEPCGVGVGSQGESWAWLSGHASRGGGLAPGHYPLLSFVCPSRLKAAS